MVENMKPKLDILSIKPLSKPRAEKPTKSRGMVGWFLATIILSVSVSAGITSYVLWDKVSKVEHGMKGLFFEFCIARANRWQNDEAARKICKDVFDSSLAAGISPFLLAKIVGHESGFDCGVVSRTGDYGCAQINLAAHGRYARGCDVIEQRCNLFTGARIFAEALDAFGGDERLALLAYNRGVGAVKASIKSGLDPSNGYDIKVTRS